MPNHFHLVIRIRKIAVIEELIRNKNNNFSRVSNFGKVEITSSEIEKFLSKQFAKLFSSYTQAFNKVNKRMGSMFIKNFKRQPIENKEYFLNAVIYTHRNPVHHGFRESMDEWPYSSYFDVVFFENTFAETQKLLAVFGGIENFIKMHNDSLHQISANLFETP
jgi:REP element-mobilizing transposase RayT